MSDPDHSAILARIDRLGDSLSEGHRVLSGKISENTTRLGIISTRLDGVDKELSGMADDRKSGARALYSIKSDVTALKLAEAKHEGERGVWAGLVRSPIVGWLGGLGIAAWAYITGGSDGLAK